MKKILFILPMLALAACGGGGIGGPGTGGGTNPAPPAPPAPTAIFIPQVGAAVGSGDGSKLGTVYVSPNTQEVALMQFVNEVRTKGTINGVPALKGTCVDGTFTPGTLSELTYNGVLAYAARKHATYNGTYGYEAHAETQPTHPNFYGTTSKERVERAYRDLTGQNIAFTWGQENAGFGYSKAADMMHAWIESPGHCRGIMEPGNRTMGMGYHTGPSTVSYPAPGVSLGPNTWVQLFGK
ncbi:CAP domain-containing protein [Deinococcus sp. MIMF12]|uniref:CAP domain-containing protein n=1 Tax=Deinococcus rhizophilus TaxID=3049544 RepID=A0ABT7JD45_9DEIO|nr:CAP domain-containing protein [Deinococcus rhizophilus]MDL2342974.1 CAP domain-containing protein [Deinococcus rhizophilus]